MFDHILVPLDGSDLSEQALPLALELADRFGNRLTLMHVVVPTDFLLSMQRGYAAAYKEIMALARSLLENAEAYLEQLQGTLARPGRVVEVCIVNDLDVSGAILREVEHRSVDAIVMSAQGYGGIRQMILGSVTDRVMRQARVPVVLVHPNNERDPD